MGCSEYQCSRGAAPPSTPGSTSRSIFSPSSRSGRSGRACARPAYPSAPLLDHMICPLEKLGRDRQTKRDGALEVDDQFKLRGLLNGEIAGLGPSKDLVDVPCTTAQHVIGICTIGHKTSCFRILWMFIERDDPMLDCEIDDLLPATEPYWSCRQTFSLGAGRRSSISQSSIGSSRSMNIHSMRKQEVLCPMVQIPMTCCEVVQGTSTRSLEG